MEVLCRVKESGIILGYIVKDVNTYMISLKDISKYNTSNAILTANGEWKAKNGYKIATITKEQIKGLLIENRNTHLVGKPSLIHSVSKAKLSGTQQKILNALDEKSMCEFSKNKDNISINMKDLSALTAYTGNEFTLFERNDKYIIVKGNQRGMFIKEEVAAMLRNKKFKWIGHTHPGTDFNCMMPSGADYDTLKYFNQKHSMVYNSVGDFYVFGLEG